MPMSVPVCGGCRHTILQSANSFLIIYIFISSSDDNATPYEEDIPVGVDSNDTL